jgi:hypothetical protein
VVRDTAFDQLPHVLQCSILQFLHPVEHMACRLISRRLLVVASAPLSWAIEFTLRGTAPHFNQLASTSLRVSEFQRRLSVQLKGRVKRLVVSSDARGWDLLSNLLASSSVALHFRSPFVDFDCDKAAVFPTLTQLTAHCSIVSHLPKFLGLTSLSIRNRLGTSDLGAMGDIGRLAPKLTHLDLSVRVYLVTDASCLAPFNMLRRLRTMRLTLDFGSLADPDCELMGASLVRVASRFVSSLVLCGELSSACSATCSGRVSDALFDARP